MVGGSFDPVHLGHLHLVHTVLTQTEYRRFIFIPVAINNFKQQNHPTSSIHRLEMLRLSCDSYRTVYPDDKPCSLVVDDSELKRGGISYTYDTVKQLYLTYSVKGRIALVMGDDLLDSLRDWHEFSALKELVTFVVIRRSNEAPSFFDPTMDLRYIDSTVYEDSSSSIRNQLGALRPAEEMPCEVRNLMCKEVARYVDEHRLYRSES